MNRALRATLVGFLAIAGACAASPQLPLALVKDVPIGEPTRRFDYASLDPGAERLFVADLAGGRVLAFDASSGRLIGTVAGVPAVHGVLVVPELHRVFASATGAHQTVAIDEASLKITARSPSGEYPDGIAWDPREGKVYVSDEKGGTVAVLDANADNQTGSIDMGGEVGNTQYDPVDGRIYSNAQGRGELVGIDPTTDKIVSRDPIQGCEGNHGLLIDAQRRLAFIACEDNARLIVFSLSRHAKLSEATLGPGPDVLAFDPQLNRLYVAGESGVVSVFTVSENGVTKIGQAFLADNAHVVSVDPTTHRVYFPLRDVRGQAVLRMMAPR